VEWVAVNPAVLSARIHQPHSPSDVLPNFPERAEVLAHHSIETALYVPTIGEHVNVSRLVRHVSTPADIRAPFDKEQCLLCRGTRGAQAAIDPERDDWRVRRGLGTHSATGLSAPFDRLRFRLVLLQPSLPHLGALAGHFVDQPPGQLIHLSRGIIFNIYHFKCAVR
jgi:hypothetical protein